MLGTGTCCGLSAIWCRAGGFTPSTVFGNLPPLHQQHSRYFRRICCYTVRSRQRRSLSSAGVFPGHPHRRLAAGHRLEGYITKPPRHGSYPYSHIANRSTPDAMSSTPVRDTVKRCPHVAVVVACAPNGSSWPLHSRRATPVTW